MTVIKKSFTDSEVGQFERMLNNLRPNPEDISYSDAAMVLWRARTQLRRDFDVMSDNYESAEFKAAARAAARIRDLADRIRAAASTIVLATTEMSDRRRGHGGLTVAAA